MFPVEEAVQFWLVSFEGIKCAIVEVAATRAVTARRWEYMLVVCVSEVSKKNPVLEENDK
jgi:hypothetical protein